MIAESSLQHAIHAWTRRHSGSWSEADETELRAWLDAANEHREAYEKVARAWTVAGELRHQLTSDQDEETPAHTSFRKVALAAGVALLALTLGLSLWPRAVRWWHGTEVSLATPKGQPGSFVLEDGTRVLLDADSALVAHIGVRSREISVLRGEALLTVTHDSSRPFEVVTDHGRIQDLGTEFDVDCLTHSTRITVLQGKVGVLTPLGRALLVAGQSGGYDNMGNLTPVSSFDIAATPQWSQGQRHFDREPLDTVLERLERYHAVTFLFRDNHLRELRVSGTFGTSDLGLFLRTLAAALPIGVKYLNPQQIEITSRPEVSGEGVQSNSYTGRSH